MATMQQVKPIIRRALRRRFNVMFRSPPAYGKTYAITEVAREEQQKDPTFLFVQIDGGTLAPTDLSMSMPDMAEKVIARLVDERLPNAYNDPSAHGMIYVGEWMLAGLEVNRGLQKLVNHEELGGFRIPDGMIFVADGNRLKDRSGAQAQSRAIMSRFDVHDIEYDTEYALEVMKGYHTKVAAFAIRNPQYIDNYRDIFENEGRQANDVALIEGKDNGAWANLRSWHRVSEKMHDADETGEALLPGEITVSVGSGVGSTFETFCRMIDNMSTLEDIEKDPKGIKLPTKADEKYALTTMLALLVTKETWEPVATYCQRYDDEFQIVFFTVMNDRLRRNNDVNRSAIRNSKTYQKWITAPHINRAIANASAV